MEGRDIVILAVKPQVMPGVLKELHSVLSKTSKMPLLISIVAGFNVETMLASLKGGQDLPIRLIRVMPNTPALVGNFLSPNLNLMLTIYGAFRRKGRFGFLPGRKCKQGRRGDRKETP